MRYKLVSQPWDVCTACDSIENMGGKIISIASYGVSGYAIFYKD